MNSYSNKQITERAQPWLGTLVSIRVGGMSASEGHRAIDAAFEEVARVHRLMSFHDTASDLSRLNGARPGAPVAVHPYTHEVLRQALWISASTDGCFDVTVGSELVEWGHLPSTGAAGAPCLGSWRDMELLPGNRVRVHRPLCIDLGGIAKGFAVDRAIASLRDSGATQSMVNAGGDIRVDGDETETILLGVEPSEDGCPALELSGGSVASSSGHLHRHGQRRGPHVDGTDRSPARTDRFVCVLAELCITADALTKVVMAMGVKSTFVLRQFQASAYLHDPETGWQTIAGEQVVAQ